MSTAARSFRSARVLEQFSAPVQQVWAGSLLAGLTPPGVERLLADAREVHFGRDELVMRGSAPSGLRLLLVVSGLARVFMHTDHGRQATLRYMSDGDLVGLPIALVTGARPVAAEALTPVHALSISGDGFVRALEQEPQLAVECSRYMAREMFGLMDMLGADIFTPVPARVARHLLDLAQREHRELTVRATNQQIADAIGSVRDVVSRAIGQLGALIERRDGALRIVDPGGLHRVACGGPSPGVAQLQ